MITRPRARHIIAPMTNSLTRRQWWQIAIGFAMASFFVPLLGHYVVVQPWGTMLVLHLATVLPLPACMGFPLASIVACVSRQHRRAALGWMALCAACLTLFAAGLSIGVTIRQ